MNRLRAKSCGRVTAGEALKVEGGTIGEVRVGQPMVSCDGAVAGQEPQAPAAEPTPSRRRRSRKAGKPQQ